MLPRLGSSKLITSWLALTITATAIGFFDGGWLAGWCALEPRRIWYGEIWRLATWPLVELGLISLIVSCMAIFWLGSELAGRWGDRRLRTYMLAVVVASGVAFSLASLATGDASLWHCGGMAVAYALVIAWARAFPDRTLVLWGIVTLQGRGIVAAAIVFALTFTLRYGIVETLTELVACTVAARYPATSST